MTLKTFLTAAVLFMIAIGGVLVYAIDGGAGSAKEATHTQSHAQQGTEGSASNTGGSDHFGCHNHGSVKYHCH